MELESIGGFYRVLVELFVVFVETVGGFGSPNVFVVGRANVVQGITSSSNILGVSSISWWAFCTDSSIDEFGPTTAFVVINRAFVCVSTASRILWFWNRVNKLSSSLFQHHGLSSIWPLGGR